MRGIFDSFINEFIFLLPTLFIFIAVFIFLLINLLITKFAFLKVLIISFFLAYFFLFLVRKKLISELEIQESKNKEEKYQKEFDERKKDLRNKYFYVFLPYMAYIFITTIALDDVTILFPENGIYLPLVEADIRPQDFAIFSTTIFFLLYVFLLWRIGNFIIDFLKKIIKNKSAFFKYNFIYLLFFGLSPLFIFLLIIWKFLKFQEFYFYYYALLLVLFVIYLAFTIFTFLSLTVASIIRSKKETSYITILTLIFLLVNIDFFISYHYLFKNIKRYEELCSSLYKNQRAFYNEMKNFSNYSKIQNIKISLLSNNISNLEKERNYPTVSFATNWYLSEYFLYPSFDTLNKIPISWNKINPTLNIDTIKEAKIPDLNKIVNYFEASKKLDSKHHFENSDIDFETLPIISIQNRSLQYANIKNIFIPKIRFYDVNLAHSKLKKVDFRDGWFEFVSFSNATIEESNFNNSKFLNVFFDKTKYKDVKLTNSFFREAIFKNSNFLGSTDLSKSKILKATLENIFIKNLITYNTNFKDIILMNSIIYKIKSPKNLKKSNNSLLSIITSYLYNNKFLYSEGKKPVKFVKSILINCDFAKIKFKDEPIFIRAILYNPKNLYFVGKHKRRFIKSTVYLSQKFLNEIKKKDYKAKILEICKKKIKGKELKNKIKSFIKTYKLKVPQNILLNLKIFDNDTIYVCSFR